MYICDEDKLTRVTSAPISRKCVRVKKSELKITDNTLMYVIIDSFGIYSIVTLLKLSNNFIY